MSIKPRRRPYQKNFRVSEGFIQVLEEMAKLPRYSANKSSATDVLHDIVRHYAQMTLSSDHQDLINKII